MPEKEIISNPSMGSNELGTETNEDRQSGGYAAGSDTQLHLAALSGKKNKKHDNTTQHKNEEGEKMGFMEADDTDE